MILCRKNALAVQESGGERGGGQGKENANERRVLVFKKRYGKASYCPIFKGWKDG